MDKAELVNQTKIAFDFIQKLYLEVSYLIKEIQGLLEQEPEKFEYGRISGYAIIAKSSTGLEPSQVNLWFYRKLAFYFAPSDCTKREKGQTFTPCTPDLKLIYMRVVLDDKDLPEPTIYFGILKDFKRLTERDSDRIDRLMTSIEYAESRVFADKEKVQYQDQNFSFTGTLKSVPLYDLNTSEDIASKIIAPVMQLFRSN